VTARLPADVIAQLAAADPEDIPGQVPAAWGLLTPYHEKAGYTAPRLERDLAYGTHRGSGLTCTRLPTQTGPRPPCCSYTAAASPQATSTCPGRRCTTTWAPGPSGTAPSESP